MIKILLCGFPCTRFSIAQTNNRETEPYSGEGWELFKNGLIALKKYKPDYFLFENNHSIDKKIKAAVSKELGVENMMINSALLSAQSRKREYWFNWECPQPEDKGILLRGILESPAVSNKEKAYTLRASAGTKQGNSNIMRHIESNGQFGYQGVFEPIRIGTIDNEAKNQEYDSQPYRVYSSDGKSVTICGEGGGVGAKTGLYACPADGKAIYQVPHGFNKGGVKYDKTPTLTANGDWTHNNFIIETSDGKTYPVYTVKDGLITIKDKQYPIKLADGYYIIRKLTVTECKRLQTVPDRHIMPVSNAQAYRQLGNGWTVDVVTHILSYIPNIRNEEIEVLSMYDGMSCGHIALDKLNANIVRYYATEIDKYAIQTTMANYPDTVQLGDAFQVRDNNWRRKIPSVCKYIEQLSFID